MSRSPNRHNKIFIRVEPLPADIIELIRNGTLNEMTDKKGIQKTLRDNGWSSDEAKTWQGPVAIDTVVGAYPSMVELPDGLVYCVYYEEGQGSSIRGVRLRVMTSIRGLRALL